MTWLREWRRYRRHLARLLRDDFHAGRRLDSARLAELKAMARWAARLPGKHRKED